MPQQTTSAKGVAERERSFDNSVIEVQKLLQDSLRGIVVVQKKLTETMTKKLLWDQTKMLQQVQQDQQRQREKEKLQEMQAEVERIARSSDLKKRAGLQMKVDAIERVRNGVLNPESHRSDWDRLESSMKAPHPELAAPSPQLLCIQSCFSPARPASARSEDAAAAAAGSIPSPMQH